MVVRLPPTLNRKAVVPFFSVRVHGEGIRIVSDGLPPIAGFYATRVVWAGSERAAQEKVIAMIEEAWTSGREAKANSGRSPVLAVETCCAVGLIRWLRKRQDRGHTFYPEEAHAV